MKFITLVFAIIAAVPQALKYIALMFYRMNKCTPGQGECLIGGEDQSNILNMLYQPNWFNTTGLWIGIAGTVVGFIGMYGLELWNRKKTDDVIDKAREHKVQESRARRDTGRMPRPGQTPRGRSRDHDDGPRPPRYEDRYSGRDDDDDDYYDDRGGGSRYQREYRRPRDDRRR